MRAAATLALLLRAAAQLLTAPGGPYTVTVPVGGCQTARVALVGGGGGGQTGFGGAGAAVAVAFPALPGENLTLWVGGGGVAPPQTPKTWGGAGGGASALVAGTTILAVAAGGGGGATNGLPNAATGPYGPGNGTDGGLPTSAPTLMTTGASPWNGGLCSNTYCGAQPAGYTGGNGGGPDWAGGSAGGLGGVGYTYTQTIYLATPGFGLGGRPGYNAGSGGGGGGSGGGGLYGGAGGPDPNIPAYPGKLYAMHAS